MWRPLGGVTLTATSDEVAIGSLDLPLIGGHLHLRFRFFGTADLIPLSFGILVPEPEDDAMGLPCGRIYPQKRPAVAALGPGVGSGFRGRIYYRLRNYNRTWLKWGQPGNSLTALVDVWAPAGTVDPYQSFQFFIRQSGQRFTPSGPRIGPLGASPLTPNG